MPNKENKKILVVDDDENIVWAVNALLTMKGYEVDLSKTGADAISKSKDKLYDLAIIDIKLPDMDGIALLNIFKDGFPQMRKIIMTGHATKDNAINALNQGADFFLTKPVRLQEFMDVIVTQLQKKT